MAMRKLRSDPPGVVGVCELCNKKFKSLASDFTRAVEDITIKFHDHTCKQLGTILRSNPPAKQKGLE